MATFTSGTGAVTLSDVAREAGVSSATASRALNGSTRNVRHDAKLRVEAAAARLGYVANAAAQATARGRSTTIAFIVNAISEDYFSPISVGVYRAADRADLMVTMVSTRESVDRAAQIVSNLRGQRPQLVIMAGGRNEERGFDKVISELQAHERDGGRVVVISQSGLPFDTVTVDNYGAARKMAAAMVDLGYGDFTIFAGPERALTPADRTRGFVDELASRGIEIGPDRIMHSDFGRDGGYRSAGEFLRRRSNTTAILSASDAMAIGALARLREAGLSLPGDMAISGFDDLVALRDVVPALTTLRLPWLEVGEKALELGLDDHRGAPRLITLDGHVVLRESTPRLV